MFESISTSVQHMSGTEYSFALMISSLIGLFGLWRAFTALHDQRTLTATPTSWLRSAAQGYTELIGRGVQIPGPKLVSPFSGRECLWYRVQAHEIGSEPGQVHAKHNLALWFWLIDLIRGDWRWRGSATLNESSDDLFYLDDDTGRCVIDPEGADIRPTLKRSWYGKTPTPDRGPGVGGSALGNRYRYTEELLLPGDILYAIGDLKTHGGAGCTQNQQDEVRTLLREWKSDQTELIARFDQDGSGHICADEWQAVRVEAQEVIQERHLNNDVPVVVNMLQQASDSRRPFVISSEPVHKVEAGYRRPMFIGLMLCLLGLSSLLVLISQRV